MTYPQDMYEEVKAVNDENERGEDEDLLNLERDLLQAIETDKFFEANLLAAECGRYMLANGYLDVEDLPRQNFLAGN